MNLANLMQLRPTQMEEPPCWKCDNTGWVAYDHNHARVCDVCCKHDKGWWPLTEAHGVTGVDPVYACRSGCGKRLTEEQRLAQKISI